MLNQNDQCIVEQSDKTRDMQCAINSLKEELESIEWYNQKIEVCKDNQLKQLLTFIRDEEKKHASMAMEWICLKDSYFYDQLGDFLFTNKPITY